MRAVMDLPASLAERARAWLVEPGEVAPARDAATVVLLRDGAAGLEVYLLRRVAAMAFAPGMHVFPGGAVDPRDDSPDTAWAGPSAAQWGRELGCDENLARALVCAAVRETFEESGVLLAGSSADELVTDATSPGWERDRRALLTRETSIAELLDVRRLVLRSDLLRAWAHWVTPEFELRRFDTRFLVAALPAGQRARDVSGEADRAEWVPVRSAVEEHDAGRMAMLPPTIAVLRDVDQPDVAAVLATPRQVRRLLPRLVETAGTLSLEIESA